MDSNKLSILGRTTSNIFSSNYLQEYSFVVIAIIVLLILITVTICKRPHVISPPGVSMYITKSSYVDHNCWPDIHQTSVSTSPQTPPASNLDETAVSTPAEILSPVQPQNSIDAKESHLPLSNICQRLVESIEQYQKQQESGGCGLENFGHSCYINSTLQCLFHIRSFVEIILNLQGQQSCQLPPIASACHRLLTDMQSISKGFTNAHEVQVRIGELNQRFAGKDEQDSHEFLTVLLEALHDELVGSYQNSSVYDLMQGTLRSNVKCLECGEDTDTYDSFMSLSLPIRQSSASGFGSGIFQYFWDKSMALFGYDGQNDITLYHCFDNLLISEQLSANGQWFCQCCEKLTDAIKKLNLYQLPKVLIIQLKRFTSDLTNDLKITTEIYVQETIDLEQLVEKKETSHPAMYDLVAVSAHTGTLASGHYTTFARHLSNRCWYHFDDQHVRQATLSEALKSDAYVLAYERRHTRPSS